MDDVCSHSGCSCNGDHIPFLSFTFFHGIGKKPHIVSACVIVRLQSYLGLCGVIVLILGSTLALITAVKVGKHGTFNSHVFGVFANFLLKKQN